MAKMTTSSDVIDDIREKLNMLSEDIDNELCEEMLDVGGDIIKFNYICYC